MEGLPFDKRLGVIPNTAGRVGRGGWSLTLARAIVSIVCLSVCLFVCLFRGVLQWLGEDWSSGGDTGYNEQCI